MTKKIFFVAILILIVLGGALYFFVGVKKSNQSGPLDPYQEPAPTFVSADKVAATDIVVKITAQGFEPAELTIQQGQKVTWVNSTSAGAWPASDPHPTHTDYPGLDPQLPIPPNQAWSFAFDRVGAWGYHDHLNPGMKGRIVVQ